MSEVRQVFLPYSPSAPWIVRQEHAVFGRFTSAAAATSAARVYASDLCRRLGVPVSVVAQDEDGCWAPCRSRAASVA